MEDVILTISRYHDKTQWARGVWDTEPDRVSWVDPDTGLPCIIRRGHSGSWCGYVGVPEGHHLFGESYWDLDVEVHGGLTFAALCGDDHETGVCHVSDVEAWWFGFDCAHAGDYMPGLACFLDDAIADSPALKEWKDKYPDHYWTMGNVMMETHHLAQQLASLKISKGGDGVGLH